MKKAGHLFYVYFVGDKFLDKPYSEPIFASDSEEAAKQFFLNHPKEYNCRIDTTAGVYLASELFPERKLVSLEDELAKLGSKLIVDRLDRHSKDILYEIFKQFPDWLILAKNETEWKERFTIDWQSPYPDNPTMWVSTAWGDYQDLVVGFWDGHIHMCDQSDCLTIECWVKRVNEYVEMIKSEKLIYYESKGLFGGYDLSEPNIITSLISEGKLKKAYSWLGTYNYPKEK